MTEPTAAVVPCAPAAPVRRMSDADWRDFLDRHPDWRAPVAAAGPCVRVGAPAAAVGAGLGAVAAIVRNRAPAAPIGAPQVVAGAVPAALTPLDAGWGVFSTAAVPNVLLPGAAQPGAGFVATPEPAAIGLFVLGVLLLLVGRLRRG